MINYYNENSCYHIEVVDGCPHCRNKSFTNTGLVNGNGYEFACDDCGYLIYIHDIYD